MEYSHARRPDSGRLRSTDARQDRCIVRAEVASRTTSIEEIRAHVAPASSQRIIGNRVLAAGVRSRVSLARLPLTPRHRKARYSGVVKKSTGEWKDSLLSSVIRVGSVCMRIMDVHVYGVDLVSVIFRTVFAHETQAPPQPSCCGAPSVTTRGNIWCLFFSGKSEQRPLHCTSV